MTDRRIRYQSSGLVDLGYGLGTAPAPILRRSNHDDLMIGTDIWPMLGRDDPGLPRYGITVNADVADNLGWELVATSFTEDGTDTVDVG